MWLHEVDFLRKGSAVKGKYCSSVGSVEAIHWEGKKKNKKRKEKRKKMFEFLPTAGIPIQLIY